MPEVDHPVSPQLLAVRAAFQAGAFKTILSFAAGALEIELRAAADAVWAVARRGADGGVALRCVHVGQRFEWRKIDALSGEVTRLKITSALGTHVLSFKSGGDALEHIRVTVDLTPAVTLQMAYLPRDLYPLGRNDDPLKAAGAVEAVQRGLNVGIVYVRMDEPTFGSLLYLQNFTALNDYFLATQTKPEDAVGGAWPELGYLAPTQSQGEEPPCGLVAGETVTLSDAILVFRHDTAPHERESARRFLQLLGTAYKMLQMPEAGYRDWVERADRTLRDLEGAAEATITHYGHRYIHPYTAAEYPDVMVQMSTIAALHQWGRWRGELHPFEDELKAGLDKFYDRKLKTLRRYLPNVGEDKDADAVDSWYLYHPLLNLGLLALDGDEDARALLMNSLDYGIRAAHHFQYKWPVQYDIRDFSVITDVAEADGRGQTDVGGVYAWVMLQAFELTDDKRYLDEARNAIEATIGLRFDINYQANLTAWGAAACMRLWRITNEAVYLEQSYVYIASFFHNTIIWQSRIGHAVHYRTFMGVTCLQDAPYMAIYECFDSFTAFEHYLNESGPNLEPAVRMLIAEYCKYALDRAWYYYPDALPVESLSPEQRDGNGHIDRSLSFPLEDLYPDGQPAGQVGQEIYGAGAAFIFASRAFHHVEGAPFLLACDHLLRASERMGDRALSVTFDGGETCIARFSLVRLKRRTLPKVRLTTVGGDALRARYSSDDRLDFHVPANGRIILAWGDHL